MQKYSSSKNKDYAKSQDAYCALILGLIARKKKRVNIINLGLFHRIVIFLPHLPSIIKADGKSKTVTLEFLQ